MRARRKPKARRVSPPAPPTAEQLAARRAAAEAEIAAARGRMEAMGREPRTRASGVAWDSAMTALTAAHAELAEVERLEGSGVGNE